MKYGPPGATLPFKKIRFDECLSPQLSVSDRLNYAVRSAGSTRPIRTELRTLRDRSWLQENQTLIGIRAIVMFCPRCGQQCSIDVRFCSRCGLPLDVIAEVTANQGMPFWDGANAPAATRTSRQKGIRIGTILMLAAVVLSPLFFALAVMSDGPAPLLAPLTLLLTGLCFVLYSRAFGDDRPAVRRPQYPVLKPPTPVLSLPHRPSNVDFGSRKVNTSDMAEPPSVTDHTTQFFD